MSRLTLVVVGISAAAISAIVIALLTGIPLGRKPAADVAAEEAWRQLRSDMLELQEAASREPIELEVEEPEEDWSHLKSDN